MTQKETILQHLLGGKSITQRKAFAYFSITRLSSIIHLLRNQGFDIISQREPNHNLRGSYVRYIMKDSFEIYVEKLKNKLNIV